MFTGIKRKNSIRCFRGY